MIIGAARVRWVAGSLQGDTAVSLLLLIDGYNLVAPVAPPSRTPDPNWLERERRQLIDRLVKHLDEDVRGRTCVVFDAANPPRDRPNQYHVDGIEICFAVGYAEADDMLEELIAAHSAPKTLAVVSSDQRVQVAARRRGCAALESQPWLDDLLDGVVGLAVARGAGQGSEQQGGEKSHPPIDDNDVQQWMREFGL